MVIYNLIWLAWPFSIAYQEKEGAMKKLLLLICLISLLSLPPVTSLAQCRKKPQGSPYQYDFLKHSERTYEQAQERYEKNPTSHNRQVMEMQKRIYKMEKEQYGK
jgi:hypothetical protein